MRREVLLLEDMIDAAEQAGPTGMRLGQARLAPLASPGRRRYDRKAPGDYLESGGVRWRAEEPLVHIHADQRLFP
jgi:hypothetical protein